MSTLASLGEKALIETLVSPALENGDSRIEVGLGDDAAVVSFPAGESLVATTDKLPERPVALELELITKKDLGWYLVVSSLSDLAAMGAAPLGILLSLCMPADYLLEDLSSLLKGARAASDEFGCPIIGGDTKGGSVVSFVSTALGHVPLGKALRRSSARPGDLLCMTGTAGRVGTALAYFLGTSLDSRFLSEVDEAFLLEGFRHPVPRLQAGMLLRTSGHCGACQDISDGLGQTAIEIGLSSSVSVIIDRLALVASTPSCTATVAEKLECDAANLLLGPGADYELMFTTRPASFKDLAARLSEIGLPVHHIGEVTVGAGLWLRDGSAIRKVESPGFEHLTSRSDINLIRDRYRRT